MVRSQYNYNTLLVVEGKLLEKDYFERLAKLIGDEQSIFILPYCCNIYSLYSYIKEEKARGAETTTKSLLLTAKSIEVDDEVKQKLRNTKFVRTYLVFDLDLQVNSIQGIENKMEIVREMIEMFDDETDDLGKILINYPMMESFRHFNFDKLDSLKDKKIQCDEVDFNNYKEIVDAEGDKYKRKVNRYGIYDFLNIAKAHCMKANFLLNGEFKNPDNFYDITPQAVHIKQTEQMLKDKNIFVLNYSSLLYFELQPSKTRIFNSKWS